MPAPAPSLAPNPGAPSAAPSTCDERYALLLQVLREHPQARLNAVGNDGLFVQLGAELRALGHEQAVARSGIELVHPDDLSLAFQAWQDLLSSGAARVNLRDRHAADQRTTLHFLDLRERFGTIVVVGYADGPMRTTDADVPRLGRLQLNELGALVSSDRDAERMLGYGPGELLSTRGQDLLHPGDLDVAVRAWVELLATGGTSRRLRLRHRRKDDSWAHLDVTYHNRLADPDIGFVVCDLVDVSAEVAAQEQARAGERMLHRMAASLPVGLLQLSPGGDIAYSNERLHNILGVPRRPRLAEQLSSLPVVDREQLLLAATAVQSDGRDRDLEVQTVGPAGRRLHVALRVVTDDDAVVEGVIGCFTDITDSTQLRTALEHRATYDALTGCLNRSAVLERLPELLCRSGPDRGCAVLFLDLDGFKAVNDGLGHAAGDDVLRRVGAVLRVAVGSDRPAGSSDRPAGSSDATVGTECLVGRLGGDEFVVGMLVAGPGEALALAARAGQLLRHPTHDGSAPVAASVGVAYVDDPAVTAQAAIGRADAAMYRAKHGGDGPVLWRPGDGGRPSRSGSAAGAGHHQPSGRTPPM